MDDVKRVNGTAKAHGTATMTGKMFNYHTKMINKRYNYKP